MEIGSLAEWVTGFAELAAVVVALFLPIIRENKKRKANQKRMIQIGVKLACRVIDDKAREPLKDVTKFKAYQDFDSYVSTVSLVNDSDTVIFALETARDALNQLSRDEISGTDAKRALKEIEHMNKK